VPSFPIFRSDCAKLITLIKLYPFKISKIGMISTISQMKPSCWSLYSCEKTFRSKKKGFSSKKTCQSGGTEFPLEVLYACRLKTRGGRFRVSQFRFRRLSEDDWTREWQKIAKPCANTSNNLNPSPATGPPGSDSAMPPQSQPERRISAAESDRPGRRRLTQNTRQAASSPGSQATSDTGPSDRDRD
jgi:hypothetical protein